ncbi:hypothetical protein K1T71_004215 [Dendrolimus kikuchii]|uniref:Uncharacterized protein n=1 Tax=Dendrolimus kikuchii TaxID=765133 RepID=A0ACC1DAY9_9NEOP|nr:hypothetical protein K1T71_004215 [Dendrolimus kikuchii]
MLLVSGAVFLLSVAWCSLQQVGSSPPCPVGARRSATPRLWAPAADSHMHTHGAGVGHTCACAALGRVMSGGRWQSNRLRGVRRGGGGGGATGRPPRGPVEPHHKSGARNRERKTAPRSAVALAPRPTRLPPQEPKKADGMGFLHACLSAPPW